MHRAESHSNDRDGDAGRQRIAELEFEFDLQRRALAKLENVHRESLALYECAPVGYILLNTSGVVCRANQSAADSFDIAEAEMRGTRFLSLVSVQSQDVFEGRLASVFSDKRSQCCDVILCRRGGVPFWVRLRMDLAPASRTKGEGVFLTVDEIGDLKSETVGGSESLELMKKGPKA